MSMQAVPAEKMSREEWDDRIFGKLLADTKLFGSPRVAFCASGVLNVELSLPPAWKYGIYLGLDPRGLYCWRAFCPCGRPCSSLFLDGKPPSGGSGPEFICSVMCEKEKVAALQEEFGRDLVVWERFELKSLPDPEDLEELKHMFNPELNRLEQTLALLQLHSELTIVLSNWTSLSQGKALLEAPHEEMTEASRLEFEREHAPAIARTLAYLRSLAP